MTALHHYWLRRPIPVVPAATPLWAWPCSPTRTGTQGLVLGVPFAVGGSILGGYLGTVPGPDGPGTGEPCDHVGVRAIEFLEAPRLQVNGFTLPASWTVETRIGWLTTYTPTQIDILRLVGPTSAPDVRVRYTTDISKIELLVSGVVVAQLTLTFSSMHAAVFHHVALTHSGGSYAVWVNGVQRLAATAAPRTGAAALSVSTVYSEDVASRYPIWLDGMRYWDVVAYTSAFTPPTALTL